MIMLSEVRKRKTDIMISLIYLIDYDTNELTYKQTHRRKKETCGCQGQREKKD